MESERRRYELRSGSRSRSRTPLVQNNALAEPEHTESHYDLRSCSRERSRTPGEVTSSRKSGSRSLPGSVGKTRDRSTEMIAEKREETASQTQSIKSEGSMVVGAKKVERRSERQKAKRQIFANGQSVSRDGSSVGDTGERRRSASPRRVLTSDYSSEEGEREDPPSRPGSAYEIYKQAGDWWNVFPKTDYTYSEKSQCRYEIAPGVLAMPNMSRRSIHSDCASSTIGSAPSTSQQNLSQSSQETTESGIGDVSDMGEAKETAAESLTTLNTSYGSLPKTRTWDSGARSAVYTKTHVERYKSHREIVYTVPGSSADLRQRSFSRPGTPPATRCIESRKYGISSTFDSDAELDDAVSVSSNKRLDTRWRMTRWVSTIVAFFVLSFAKLLQVLKVPTIIGNQERRATHDYRRYHDSRWTRMWRYIDHSSSQYIYLLMVKIFFFDSWLLSRVSNVRRWLQDRGPKVVWIALLPLLLLAGYSFLSLPLSTSLLSARSLARNSKDAFFTGRPATVRDESLVRRDDLRSIVEELNDRIDKLVVESGEQTDRLSDVTRTLEGLREPRPAEEPWMRFNDKIVLLEKRLDERKFHEANAMEMNTIKSEFEELKELYSQLKTCCKTQTEIWNSESMEKRIEGVIADYFDVEVSKSKLSGLVRNLMLATNAGDSTTTGNVTVTSDIGEDRVREIVKEALRIYDADKTGRVDYALESAGGQIISTRCTQRYDIKTRAFKLLAFTLYHENNNPRTVIQGNPIQPGACWAFQGFPGYLLVKLRSPIYVTGFTVEHAPKSILPNGEMRSAPRKFNAWGFTDENDPEPVMFGDYEFAASDESLQYFPVQNTLLTTPYEYVELRVHSNHGQLEYTCLYRFRVHGKSV